MDIDKKKLMTSLTNTIKEMLEIKNKLDTL